MADFKIVKKSPLLVASLAALILSLAAFLLLALFGAGAVLGSNQSGDCVLVKKTLLTASEEHFQWKDVKEVRLSGSLGLSSSSGRGSGTNGENLELEMTSGKKILVYPRKVAWPFGNLNRENLRSRIDNRIDETLWSVSLGGVSWFLSFILGAVAGVILLMRIVVPITPGMEAKKLSAARKANLFRFILLVLGAAGFWTISLAVLIQTLSSGAALRALG